MNVGESLTFNYTGGIQTANLTDKGLYRFDVWGAEGGRCRKYASDSFKIPGKGGHSWGYIIVDNPQTFYIVCGGHPADSTTENDPHYDGGYNGGGTGGHGDNAACGGGGATHIATVTGLLKNIGYTQFVTNRKGLLVAGGGGGHNRWNNNSNGSGGGLTGGNGLGGVQGGTQTSGYAFGQGESASGSVTSMSGAGGGLYGGFARSGEGVGPAGGSGYINGMPTVTFRGMTYAAGTENGVRSGHGYATITYVAASSLPIKLGTADVVSVKKGIVDVSALFKGTTPIGG